MKKLTPEQKQHLVYQLACFVTPTALVAEMKDLFGLDLTTSAILAYDPTTAQGRNLGPELRKEFDRAREEYAAAERNVAIGNRRWRLQYLQDLLESNNVKRNPAMALKIMEHIEKAQGKMFERADPVARFGKNDQGPGSDAKGELLGEMTEDELDRRIAEAEARKAAETVPEGS